MNIKKYKNKLRLIVIYTDNYSNKKYIEAKEKYKKNIKKFHKRYAKLITYKSIKNKFKIQLIGFDNKLKKTYDKIKVKQIINDIDKMPMGHLRNNKNKLVNLSLYEDYNPKTTIKNLGFKNKEKALYTIEAIKDRPIKYQTSVVATMIGRAKNHPHQTENMRDAIKVFQAWMKKHKKNSN